MEATLGTSCPPSSSTLLGFDSMLSVYAQLLPLSGTLASADMVGGPKSPRGHNVPEENQSWFCASPNETLNPHHSLCFIAHLGKALQAAHDLPLSSVGALDFKTPIIKPLRKHPKAAVQRFALYLSGDTAPPCSKQAAGRESQCSTALMLTAGMKKTCRLLKGENDSVAGREENEIEESGWTNSVRTTPCSRRTVHFWWQRAGIKS